LAVDRSRPGEVELLGWNILADRKRIAVKPVDGEDRVFLEPPGFAGGVWLRTEPHATTNSPGKLGPLPVTVSGRLSKPGDRATFSFEAVKKKPISIELESRSLDLPVDAVITVRSAAGKSLQTARAAKLNVDPSLEFVPPEDGVYTLEVRDLLDGGGPRHEFLVRLRPQMPGFEATLTADSVQGKVKSPIDVPLTVEYRGGLKGPLEVHAEGLPDGARTEFVAGKDAKKGIVRIHGIDAPFSGAVRFYLKAADQPERVVILAEPRISWLWFLVKE
jgi:hypothetical protein